MFTFTGAWNELLLGLIFTENGESRGAEHHFRAALKAQYDPKEVLPHLAQSLLEQAEFEKVLEATRFSDYGDAVLQPEVQSLRGHSQLMLARPADAAKSFEEALKRKPEYAPALLGQARLALLGNDVQAAFALMERALAADPSSVDARLMKGDLHRAAGRLEEALAEYQKVLALNPRSFAANLNLATLYLTLGKTDGARKYVETMLTVAPNAAAGYYLLGLLEFQKGNYVAAEEAVQRVQKAMPNHLPAAALAGVIAYLAGNNEQAEQRLGETLSRYPGSVYLRKSLAAALLKSGKVRQAIEVLEPALAARAGRPDPGLFALFAEAKFRNNEIAVARKYNELAAKDYPRSPGLRTGLGLTRLAAGDTEKALADLEAAVELGGDTADLFLARTLLSMKQFDKALAAASRLEAKRPKDPVTFNLKGSVLFAMGDAAGARKAFERAVELQPLQFAAAMNLAQLDARENKPAAARKRFEKILERDKENVPAMLALADMAAASNNRADALAWARRAKHVQPKGFAASMALARLYFAASAYAEVVPAARDAAAASDDNAEALNLLGYSQMRLGQRTQALETYSTLASRYPNSAEAQYGLAGALTADGQNAAAERALTKALAMRPNFPEAIYALADLQLRRGKIGEVHKLAGDVRKRLPKSSLGHVIEGDAALKEKRLEAAVRAYEDAYKLEQSSPLLLRLYGALRDTGKTAAADALAATWLQKNPNDIQVRYAVADAAIRNQNFRLAAEHYQQALRIEPAKLSLLHNLGWVYERLGDARALEVAESAYKVAPNDPGVLHNLGRLLVESGKAGRAVEILEQARLLAPESQLVRYQLARAYVKSGARANARMELEQLLRGKQEFAERAAAAELLQQLRN